MNDIHVVPNEHDEWSVADTASPERPVSTHTTQKEAVAAARLHLEQNGGGDLTLHAKDGTPRDTTHVEGNE